MSENTSQPAPEPQPSNPGTGQSNGDPREALRRDLDKYRLPADVKTQILAELPSVEEMERQYREVMEKGGLSFKEFFESLLAEVQSQP
jgi:hypothetical protein